VTLSPQLDNQGAGVSPSIANPRAALALVEHYRTHGFKDAEELLKFIEAFWGLKMPRAGSAPNIPHPPNT
jgi:hypothetical protein